LREKQTHLPKRVFKIEKLWFHDAVDGEPAVAAGAAAAAARVRGGLRRSGRVRVHVLFSKREKECVSKCVCPF
jgi:hypothetical protein